jgi:hypothetical protein
MCLESGCTAGIPFNQTEVFVDKIRLVIKTAVSPVVMSKMIVPISFWNETKTFWYCSRIVLLKTDCFDLVQNLLSWTNK